MPNPFKVNEGVSARYTARLVDENNNGIGGNSLTSLTLTLYDKKTDTIINARDKQNVLNANGVTVSNTGGLTWTLTANDNAMVSNTASAEIHVALFEWEWAPNGSGKHEFLIQVQNLRRV